MGTTSTGHPVYSDDGEYQAWSCDRCVELFHQEWDIIVERDDMMLCEECAEAN